MRREFRAVRLRQATDIARVLDHCNLHAETDSEVRDTVFAREAHRLWPNTRFQLMPGVDHLLMLEEPAAFNERVLDFRTGVQILQLLHERAELGAGAPLRRASTSATNAPAANGLRSPSGPRITVRKRPPGRRPRHAGHFHQRDHPRRVRGHATAVRRGGSDSPSALTRVLAMPNDLYEKRREQMFPRLTKAQVARLEPHVV